MKKIIITIFTLIFIGIIAYGGYQIWDINQRYADESKIHDMVLEYKPADNNINNKENKSITDMQVKYPDTVGWITVPGTEIDYPFMWYKDNDFYLSRDINGKYAFAGTLFMDYRCNKDFLSQNTIIYGHHMKNGSMFGTLKSFADEKFFDGYKYGTIYLPQDNLTLEFFAYIVVQPTDKEIYSTQISETYFEYVKKNAKHYRDIGVMYYNRIITLSTCANNDSERLVLIAKMTSEK